MGYSNCLCNLSPLGRYTFYPRTGVLICSGKAVKGLPESDIEVLGRLPARLVSSCRNPEFSGSSKEVTAAVDRLRVQFSAMAVSSTSLQTPGYRLRDGNPPSMRRAISTRRHTDNSASAADLDGVPIRRGKGGYMMCRPRLTSFWLLIPLVVLAELLYLAVAGTDPVFWTGWHAENRIEEYWDCDCGDSGVEKFYYWKRREMDPA